MPTRWSRTKKKTFRTATSPGQPWLRQALVGFVVVSSLIGLLVAVYYVTRVERWQIREVVAEGGVTVSPDTVESVVLQTLDGFYAHLIPRSFFLTYSKEAARQAVFADMRIKDVVLTRQGKVLQVTFSEYIPQALWCAVDTPDQCYLLDASGFAFAPAPQLSGKALMRYFDERLPERAEAFTPEFMAQTQMFANQVARDFDARVSAVVITPRDGQEYVLAHGGRLKLSAELPSEVSFANLTSIFNSAEFAHLQRDSFEYIDLRFGEKVFIKEVAESATSTEAEMAP